MSRSATFFCRTTILITNISAMAFVFCVALFKDEGMILMPGLFFWIAFVIACSLTQTLLSGKERTLRFIMLVTAAFFAVQAIVCFIFTEGYSTFERVLFILIFWMFSYYRCFLLIKSGMKQEQVTDNFDLSVIILLLAAACATMSSMEMSILLFPAIAAALSLSALICARADSGNRSGARGKGIRGSSIIVGTVIVIAGAAAGAVALFSDAIRTGIKAFFKALFTALKWLGKAVIAFLLKVFPPRIPDEGGMIPAVEGTMSGEGESTTELFFTSEWLFRGIIIGIIALLVAVAVVRFIMGGRHKTSVAYVSASVKKKRLRRHSFGAAFARFSQRTRFFIDSIIYRNTARGLFAWLLRRGITMRIARKKGETPRAFIERLSEKCPASRERLLEVSDILDREFFGECREKIMPHDIAVIRRELSQLLRSFTVQKHGEKKT